MAEEIYIFAGGGTGGHLYPGLAVAEELARLRPGARVVFACSDRAIDRRILEPTPHAIVPQPVRPLPRGVRGWGRFLRAWLRSGAQAGALVRDLRPAAVLGLGGFAAGPVVGKAARAGIPAALLNPDAVPGKANRYLARRVDVIFTQFPAAAEHFPPRDRAKVRRVGCPLRGGLASAERDEALATFDLLPGRRTLLVTGGSQGAASINAAVADLQADLDALADAWQVLHVTGPGEQRSLDPAGHIHVRTLDYCDRMDLAYAAADLALCRAGAVTVAEVAATATPAVFLPYPHHADRQQHHNAAALAEAGAAVVVEDAVDPAANAEALRRRMLPLMADPAALKAMSAAGRGFGGADAATAVARWLLEAPGGGA